MILLSLWRWAELTLHGAYTHGGKKARIIIKYGRVMTKATGWKWH
jgi:hypothetical protein